MKKNMKEIYSFMMAELLDNKAHKQGEHSEMLLLHLALSPGSYVTEK